MLIATFNCNSVRQRLGIIQDWLEQYSPDVLALQETKVIDDLFPEKEFQDKGWHATFRGEKSYNGVAILTKGQPENVSFGLQDGDDGESETRMIHVRYQGVELINTYVPQGHSFKSPKFEFKQKWLDRIKSYFQGRFNFGSDNVVWLGDLNIAPSPEDVYDHKKIWPHVVHCQQMTDAYDEFIGMGFVDIFRKYLHGEGHFTFFDYRVKTSVSANRGWRIDHILASAPLADRSTECFVDIEPRKREKPSDHTFLVARFS